MTAGTQPVLVLGAGPAGLTAGLELARTGVPALVLEQDELVGGLSRTVEVGGYRFDLGGHRFFTKSREVRAIWRDLLGDDLLERPRLSRIYYRERYFDYPLRPLSVLAGLGPLEAARVLASWARARLFPPLVESSFEDWVVARFGRRLFEVFFETYTEKVWGIPCREISADWAAQRIRNLDLVTALRSALLGRNGRGGELVVSLIDRFHYPRLGPGMMWERCREKLSAAGVETRTGASVVAIHHDGRRVVEVTTESADGTRARIEAGACISSIPLRHLVERLDPAPPEAVRAAAARLRYRDFLTVAVVVDRAEVFPDNWLYVHAPEVRVGRIQNFKNWSPEMVPDPSRTSLGLEYFLQEGEPFWRAPDAEVVALAVRELGELRLVRPDEIVDAAVIRVPKAYPVYDRGYRDALATLREWLGGLENLEVVGRNGQHRYNNQDHSMLTGLCAARNRIGVLAGAPPPWDVWSVNAESEYLEEARGSEEGGEPGDRLTPRRRDAERGGESELDELVRAAFARYDPVALGGAFGLLAAATLVVAAVVSSVRGGESQGPTLSLLANYLPAFRQTAAGTLLGAVEVGAAGFVLGALLARSINGWVRRTERALRQRLAAAIEIDPLEARPE